MYVSILMFTLELGYDLQQIASLGEGANFDVKLLKRFGFLLSLLEPSFKKKIVFLTKFALFLQERSSIASKRGPSCIHI